MKRGLGFGCWKRREDTPLILAGGNEDGEAAEVGVRSGEEGGKLGVMGLASLAFFSVAGTPVGSEDAIKAAGPRLGLLGFIVMPFIWSIPEALVTAELASTFPHNGGFVVWVNEAFGERMAYQEGLLKWMSGLLDSAVYPVMMLNYLRTVVPELESTPHAELFFCMPVVAVLTAAQYVGIEIVGTTSTVVIVVTLMPFIVLVCWGLPNVEGSKLTAKKDGELTRADWSLFLINLFWNLNYWDSISTLASEVDNPGRTFPRALAVAMVLTVGMYISVLGVAVGTAPEGQSWENSELADAGAWVAGEWLKIWIVISVSISCIGLYLAEVSTDIFMLEGMAGMGMLPKFFHRKNKFGTPVVGLAIQTTLVVFFINVLGDMETIIAWEMVSYCVAQVLEFGAFIKLRQKYPNVKRPFKSPGGTKASMLLLLPATLFTFLLMGLADWDVWLAGAVQVGGCFGVTLLLQWARGRYPDAFLESDFNLPSSFGTDQSQLLDSTNEATVLPETPTSSPARLHRPFAANGTGTDETAVHNSDFLAWFSSKGSPDPPPRTPSPRSPLRQGEAVDNVASESDL